MSLVNDLDLDITERLRDHSFAVEYVNGLEEAAHKDSERIAEEREQVSYWRMEHDAAEKRIAELEAALKNLHDEFDLVPALTREAIASEREECALIVERRATVASAAEAEICREISAAIRARAA